ncbi:MAG: rhomboid family protein [Chryseobacterium sp.]|nr:MAG: rhomboid family protein [Chryseobacterium sp.]
MSQLLILGIIIIAILAFFNREWIKNRFFPDEKRNYTIDDQFNSDKRDREKEIDRLLSKMGKNGVNDLSAKDRKRLDELSKK